MTADNDSASKDSRDTAAEETLRVLTRTGVLIEDSHIVYRSGQHGSTYVNKDVIYTNVGSMVRIGQVLAEQFGDLPADAILAPATGGILLGHLTAARWPSLHRPRQPVSFFADKDGDGFRLGRGYARMITGMRIVIVDDIITEGGTIRALISLARRHGCLILGVGAICNRGNVTAADLGIDKPELDGSIPRFLPLASLPLASWDASACPLCARGVPVNTDLGRGREFVLRARQSLPRRIALSSLEWIRRRIPAGWAP